MTAREILAYAITHAPKGVKGGPYEGSEATEPGTPVARLRDGMRYGPGDHECALDDLDWIRRYTPAKNARVIRIVRARPSEATPQPSEASAVAVLRELVAAVDGYARDDFPMSQLLATCTRAVSDARRVLAASGPDPSEVVRAAMRFTEHCTPALEGSAWFVATREFIDAVDAYRKAGGK